MSDQGLLNVRRGWKNVLHSIWAMRRSLELSIVTRHNARIAFLSKQSWLWCQWLWTSPGRRSWLLMFGLGFRHMQRRLEYMWPQLRRTHRLHIERNFGQVRLALAHARWLGYQISRERNVLSETNESFFGLSASQHFSSLAVSGKVCCFSLCPNIIFDGMTSTMIGFTESSSASTVVTSQMVRRPNSNNLNSFNLQIGCRIDLKHLTKRLLWWKPHQGIYKVDLLQTAALFGCNVINGRTHTNRRFFCEVSLSKYNKPQTKSFIFLKRNKVLCGHDAATKRHLPFCMLGLRK